MPYIQLLGWTSFTCSKKHLSDHIYSHSPKPPALGCTVTSLPTSHQPARNTPHPQNGGVLIFHIGQLIPNAVLLHKPPFCITLAKAVKGPLAAPFVSIFIQLQSKDNLRQVPLGFAFRLHKRKLTKSLGPNVSDGHLIGSNELLQIYLEAQKGTGRHPHHHTHSCLTHKQYNGVP